MTDSTLRKNDLGGAEERTNEMKNAEERVQEEWRAELEIVRVT